jgi:hypothetical protein
VQRWGKVSGARKVAWASPQPEQLALLRALLPDPVFPRTAERCSVSINHRLAAYAPAAGASLSLSGRLSVLFHRVAHGPEHIRERIVGIRRALVRIRLAATSAVCGLLKPARALGRVHCGFPLRAETDEKAPWELRPVREAEAEAGSAACVRRMSVAGRPS